MMIELVKGSPIIIPVEAIPKANITINYKTKNIPAHKLKNPAARKAKERFDHAMQIKDFMVMHLKSERNKRCLFHDIKRTDKCWVSVIYYFQYLGGKDHKAEAHNETLLVKDTDNCNKLLNDVFQAADYMPNDCQISFQMTGKQVVKSNPRIEIVSMAFADSWKYFMEWSSYSAKLTAHRIYEHQLSILP